ncbi:PLP-dependent aminotransferase family protein [Mesorhizobium sp. M0309]|uniref:PLP-dependent aminotransferase family protein n=1 Tax=Mesorhizobium sp. M0309 TaxID=2956933 RepID=UPI0033353810
MSEAVRQLASEGNGGYGEPSGMLHHRAAYADWIGRMGTVVDPSALMLTVNAQHAVDMAFSDIASETKVLAVDAATYPGALASARLRGFQLVPMATDEDGTRPDELLRAITVNGAGAYYSMPTAHSPLGVHMPLARREQIAEICRQHGMLVVEDDACVPLRKAGITSLKSLMPDNVFYVTSTAKSFSPLFTSGVTIPPRQRFKSTLGILVATVWSVAPLTSAIMARIFDERADVVFAERLRHRTAERLALAQDLLDLPASDDLSFHVWIPMPLVRAERMARRCLDNGIRITPPTATVVGPGDRAGVRLCLGAPPTLDRLKDALMRIAPFRHETPEAVV